MRRAGRTLPWASVRTAIEAALQGRLLDRAEDSGAWPCDYADARQVKLKAHRGKVIDDGGKPKDEPAPGVWVASAQLKTSQLQELADQIGSISNAAVGHDLKVIVRIEVGGEGKRPPDDVIAAINGKLKEISPELELK